MVGLGLVPFAALVRRVATSQPIGQRGATAVIVADAAWVIGSIVLLAVPDLLTAAGTVGVVLVATVVAGFGVTQTMGIRSIARP